MDAFDDGIASGIPSKRCANWKITMFHREFIMFIIHKWVIFHSYVK